MYKEITYAEALQMAATLLAGRAEVHSSGVIKIDGILAANVVDRLADDILFATGTQVLAAKLERKNV